MVIFAAVAGACWALLDAGRGVSARGAAEAARSQTARVALRAIEADVRGAFSAFTGTDGGTEDRPRDTLAVVTVAHQPSLAATEKETDVVRSTFSIDENKGLVRERRKRLTENVTVLDAEAYVEEIARDVVALQVRYTDGSGWVDSWNSDLSGQMPKAVEVTVHVRGVWRGAEDLERFTSRFYLPVAANAPKRQP
ncbi:MAG: hypothetical protein HYY16_15680 [Planctomycetes bacterium]|nr:hypothetical protein [Planctomycetota bacterium]